MGALHKGQGSMRKMNYLPSVYRLKDLLSSDRSKIGEDEEAWLSQEIFLVCSMDK